MRNLHLEEKFMALELQSPAKRGWVRSEIFSSLPPANISWMLHLCLFPVYSIGKQKSVISKNVTFDDQMKHCHLTINVCIFPDIRILFLVSSFPLRKNSVLRFPGAEAEEQCGLLSMITGVWFWSWLCRRGLSSFFVGWFCTVALGTYTMMHSLASGVACFPRTVSCLFPQGAFPALTI